MEVSFTTSTVLETRSGNTLRTACGNTTEASVVDLAVIARRIEEERDRDGRERGQADAGERQARIDEDQQDQRRHGAEEIDCHDHGVARGARCRERDECKEKSADQAERDD